MFKHSDVLTSIKPVKAAVSTATQSTEIVHVGRKTFHDMAPTVPVQQLLKINEGLSKFALNRDGDTIVAAFASFYGSEVYRVVISSGFVIDVRIMDSKIYYDTYLGRVKTSARSSYKEFDDLSLTVYYADISDLNSPEEFLFNSQLASCYACGYD